MVSDKAIKNTLCCIFAIGCIYFVNCEEEFGMSEPDLENWANPDDMFSPPLKTDALIDDEDAINCQENLLGCNEKLLQCEQLLSSSDVRSGEKSDSRPDCIPCQEEKDGAKVFLQRFIHLLLDVSNLNTQDVEAINKAEFSFYMSDEQLLTLRQFARGGKGRTVPLRKVDEVFAAVLAKPYFDISRFKKLSDKLPEIKVGSFFITALVPTVWFFGAIFLTRSIRKSFMWLTPVIFLTSFITTATQMFEEAQLKNYEQIKHNVDVPPSCKSPILFGSYSDECASYLKAHHMDPNLGITTVKILTKMFGETMAETMGNFGAGSVGFFSHIQGLGWLTQIWITPIAVVLLVFFLLLVALVLSGGSIRLPWFLGGGVSFSNPNEDSTVRAGQGAAVQSTRNIEISPPTHNITFNISGPAIMNDLLRPFSQGAHQPIAHSNSYAEILPQIPSTAVDDPLAAGDSATQRLDDHYLAMSSRKPHRPTFNIGSKKNKQFSYLNAKYKAGNKSNKSISRARHLSL
ncbi:SOSS complex subunit B2 [Frankliniella fusca]|uniref:SOSS complex subunit B2 n=1 Tax=Frankliniella fusca TaxID=407009 RepID=A0AAE1GXM2_9NEOP|nr:SOSS complex subunit B2 [Frankliniella fusca]